jgi:superfamily II DNA or RNA helicase
MAAYSTIQQVKVKQKIATSLFGAEDEMVITLRDEQKKAVADALRRFKKKSGNKFLWNAKMRFGKTLCALQLAREMGEWEGDAQVKRTLIVTHRPVVNKSWSDDFAKIFHDKKGQYLYGTKFDDDSFGNFYDLEQQVEKQGKHYMLWFSPFLKEPVPTE